MEDIAKKLKSGNYHFYRYHTTLKKNSKMGFPTHFPGNLKHWPGASLFLRPFGAVRTDDQTRPAMKGGTPRCLLDAMVWLVSGGPVRPPTIESKLVTRRLSG